jgi:7-keto-8-aminopelargonate synthetase-like enzyme
MKRTLFKSVFALIFSMCLSAQVVAQTERVITLQVNTVEINSQNVNEQSTFGQAAEISNEEFTVEASVGDTIVWEGVSSVNGDLVLIEAINHEGARGGRDIFGQNRLPGENGIVRGTILNTTDEGADYKYKITFRIVSDNTNRQGVYHIDPKIRVVGQ